MDGGDAPPAISSITRNQQVKVKATDDDGKYHAVMLG